MTAITEFFKTLWTKLVTLVTSINIFTSILDIVLVALVIYAIIRLVRDSRAEQLLKGLLLLGVAFILSSVLELKTLHYLLSLLFDNALILVVVIFQPEIRRALEQAGNSRMGFLKGLREDRQAMAKAWKKNIAATCKAVESLQKQQMGALIVFERQTKLGDIVSSGTVVEAEPSAELIGNLFFKNSPLHDGAMIMREGRVYAAGCILPLTEVQIGRSMGTRHRAAVGMSENSDALVVVVSEETGMVSIAAGGTLRRGLTSEELKSELESGMLAALPEDKTKKKAGKKKKTAKKAPAKKAPAKDDKGEDAK